MHRLTPVVQPYAWGSRERLARLTGRPHPTPEPEAELWLGAHEAAPSRLEVDGADRTLDRLVAERPEAFLGADVAARFDGRLPYLLKVLAPAKALSIQVHPDVEQAQAAAEGTYADGWAKPESWLAVEPTEAFVGSRPFEEIRAVAARLAVDRLTAAVGAAEAAQVPAHELLRLLLELEGSERDRLVDDVLIACARCTDDPTVAAVLRVAEQHPGDIGLVVLLTMQRQALRPGEYVFLAAGVLHTLTVGLVVEILANSDNVVRAGLTSKRVDVPELLRVVDVRRSLSPRTGRQEEGWTAFAAETPYYRLRFASLTDTALPVPAEEEPRIVLCLHGSARLTGSTGLELGSGEGAYLLPGEDVSATGDGTLYLASPGPP